MRQAWRACAAIYLAVQSTALMGQEYPEGISREVVAETDEFIAGLAHGPNGVTYSWTLDGKVFAVVNDNFPGELVLDISEEVGFWGDHGMLGFALDPNFLATGRFYLLYPVDQHHLLNFGTPNYDPSESTAYTASIGRLTRYEVSLADYKTIVPGSRTILIGDSIHNGIPLLTASHGVGALVFGSDGTLLLSTGDSNAWGQPYNGIGEPNEFGYDLLGLELGIIDSSQHVGGFRAQLYTSLCGKILRVDPENGSGVPSNPFYNSENPFAPESRVWALGFRNPFRFSNAPNTGSSNPADGYPGDFYIGDVGDWSWEEINLLQSGGENFGWPLFQGMEPYFEYQQLVSDNPLAPHTNSGSNGNHCGDGFYSFQSCLVQPRENHLSVFPDPCNAGSEIPDSLPLFIHSRPVLAYKNNALSGPPRTQLPGFSEDGEAMGISLDDPEHGLEDVELFSGISAVGGALYEGSSFPEEYHGMLLFGDYSGWLRAVRWNDNQDLEYCEYWDNGISNLIHISYNPVNEAYYTVSLAPNQVSKIAFQGNRKPVIISSPDTTFGASPFEVQFDASASYDPEGTAISFLWEFGDGTVSTSQAPTHVFSAQSSNIEQYAVNLTVTDSDGLSAQKNMLISLNNTPPVAEIVSIEDDQLYAMHNSTSINLRSESFDNEDDVDDLSYVWTLYLHHNTHFHREIELPAPTGVFEILPVGCGVETYFYRIALRVTDSGGLTSKDSKFLYPDCEGLLGQQWQRDGETQVWAYPSPASEELKLLVNAGRNETIFYQIYDLQGKELKAREYLSGGPEVPHRIDVGALQAGMYLLKVRTSGWEEVVRIAKR